MHKAPGSGCRRTCVCPMAFGLRVCRSRWIIIIIGCHNLFYNLVRALKAGQNLHVCTTSISIIFHFSSWDGNSTDSGQQRNLRDCRALIMSRLLHAVIHAAARSLVLGAGRLATPEFLRAVVGDVVHGEDVPGGFARGLCLHDDQLVVLHLEPQVLVLACLHRLHQPTQVLHRHAIHRLHLQSHSVLISCLSACAFQQSLPPRYVRTDAAVANDPRGNFGASP